MAYPYPPAGGAAQPVVMSPPVPFMSSIFNGPMQPGMMIFIHGYVPAGAERFHVNLQCGTSTQPRADVAFHFNPRFGGNVVVRNTLTNQKWGNEERDQTHFPFAHNQPFEMIMLCEQSRFRVAVNGQHFLDYNHRIQNLNRVDTICIDGQVVLNSVRFQPGSMSYMMQGGTFSKPPTPYVGPIVSGMQPGRLIFISGTVRPGADRFHVNLQCGANTQPRSDVAFHFNPRFGANTVVRNSLRNQSWGNEERNVQHFPFAPGAFFEIIILCEPDCYRVAVNGQHYLEYKHRIPIQNVNTLSIDGAVDLHQVRFQ